MLSCEVDLSAFTAISTPNVDGAFESTIPNAFKHPSPDKHSFELITSFDSLNAFDTSTFSNDSTHLIKAYVQVMVLCLRILTTPRGRWTRKTIRAFQRYRNV